jgi:3-carboxy-cis,cis-muconate cycloisomerase
MTFSALDSDLTGPLFATEAMRACFSDEARLGAMLAAEAALARAEAALGLAPVELAAAVESISPASLGAEAIGRQTALAGVPTIPFVKAAQASLPPALERSFHKGATTQDILDTALVLQMKQALPLIAADLVGTLAGLGARGPEVLDGFARELGLTAPPIAWHARRGRIAEAGGWLAQLIGALAKIATDVANLASTEVGEAAEPYVAGRGGSTAMPHKRNPVSCTVILAAHGVAPGLAATLLTSMAAAHERPAGLWHAEWHALPTLFGLVSGALREARALAEGLEVDPARMEVNLDATHGLLFADAAAARLGAKLGREAAHSLVEHAANEVRRTGDSLLAVLARDAAVLEAGIDLAPAFDLTPAIAAACPWVDRAVKQAALIRVALLEG